MGKQHKAMAGGKTEHGGIVNMGVEYCHRVDAGKIVEKMVLEKETNVCRLYLPYS